MRKILTTMLVLFAIGANADIPRTKPSNFTCHQVWQPVISFPFIFEPNEKVATVFVKPMMGIKIISIFADGKEVVPVPARTDYDGLNDRTIEIQGQFTYNLYSDSPETAKFWTVTSVENTGEKLSIHDFDIPKGAGEIVISYQIRYSDFTLSKLKTLVSKKN